MEVQEDSNTPQQTGATSSTQASRPSQQRSSSPPRPRQPGTLRTPEQVKEEQARLLTLLQTLDPAVIVNQVVQAITFFGGLPDGPAVFPESGEGNGRGSAFVEWIAEIFPNPNKKWNPKDVRVRDVVGVKRPRGRPKGSKASKVRKDKGTKKPWIGRGKKPGRPPKNRTAQQLGAIQPSGATGETRDDGDWVDVVDIDDDGHDVSHGMEGGDDTPSEPRQKRL